MFNYIHLHLLLYNVIFWYSRHNHPVMNFNIKQSRSNFLTNVDQTLTKILFVIERTRVNYDYICFGH